MTNRETEGGATPPSNPNSIADALIAADNDPAWVKAAIGTIAAAGFEVVPAGTADQLAAAERWRDAWKESAEMMEARARAAEARLAALTDAIGAFRANWNSPHWSAHGAVETFLAAAAVTTPNNTPPPTD